MEYEYIEHPSGTTGSVVVLEKSTPVQKMCSSDDTGVSSCRVDTLQCKRIRLTMYNKALCLTNQMPGITLYPADLIADAKNCVNTHLDLTKNIIMMKRMLRRLAEQLSFSLDLLNPFTIQDRNICLASEQA